MHCDVVALDLKKTFALHPTKLSESFHEILVKFSY